MPDHRSSAPVAFALLAAGGLLCALAWGVALPWIGAAPDATRLDTGRVLTLLMVWGALVGALLWWLDRQEFAWGGTLAFLAFGLAVAMRLPLLLTTPLFSDDLWRYLWEGRIQTLGGNPYAVSALEFAASGLGGAIAQADPLWRHINHPEISAIYPPLAQSMFFAVAAVWYSPLAMKGVMVLFDLLVGFGLLTMLRARGDRPHLCLAWLWSPFVCFEVAGAGHIDVVAAFLILGWLAGLEAKSRGGECVGAIALGAAVVVKVIPIVLFPVALRWHRHRWVMILSLLAIAVPCGFQMRVGVAPDDELGLPWSGGANTQDLTRALRTYEAKWRHNDSVHWLVYEATVQGATAMTPERAGLEPHGIAGFERRARRGEAIHRENEAALRISRGICYALFLAGIALALWRCRSASVCALWVLGLFILLRPTIHPWYFLLILPLAILERRWSWWVLSILSLGTYVTVEHYRQTGEWSESTLAWAIQWSVFFGILGWEASQRSKIGKGDLKPHVIEER